MEGRWYKHVYTWLTERDLDINTKDVESLSIELISEHSESTVLSTIYRVPDGDFKA